jgi:large-conductance mechanosensitive channel
MAKKIEAPESIEELPLTLIKNIVSLTTSGFGLVVALAWNEVIKTAVDEFIKPVLGKGGGLISLAIYAMVITALAVIITMQLANIEKTLQKRFTQDQQNESTKQPAK